MVILAAAMLLIAAAIFHLWLANFSQIRHREVIAFGVWSAALASAIAIALVSIGESPWAGLVFGPLIYLLWRGSGWLRAKSYSFGDEERKLEEARMRRHATDFQDATPAQQGPVAPKPRPAPSFPSAPIIALPSASILAEQTRDDRPGWQRAAEVVVVVMVAVVGVAGYLAAQLGLPSAAPQGEREAVAAAVEAEGYGVVRVKRRLMTIDCRERERGYDWSAGGARGVACAYGDEARVFVRRTWRPSKPQGSASPSDQRD